MFNYSVVVGIWGSPPRILSEVTRVQLLRSCGDLGSPPRILSEVIHVQLLRSYRNFLRTLSEATHVQLHSLLIRLYISPF